MIRLHCVCSQTPRQFRGKCPVFLLPITAKEAVQTAYSWGARNCEIHFSQCRGETNHPAGLPCQPSCLRQAEIIIFFYTSPGYQTNRAFPCQKEPRPHPGSRNSPRSCVSTIQVSNAHSKQCPAVLRFLEPARFRSREGRTRCQKVAPERHWVTSDRQADRTVFPPPLIYASVA